MNEPHTIADAIAGAQHVILEQLDRPQQTTAYVWAPTGDVAFAMCSERLWRAAQGPMNNGWPMFRYLIVREFDWTIPAGDALQMQDASITLAIRPFRHKSYDECLALCFATPNDQRVYLEAYPHLAVGADSQPPTG